MAVTRYPEGSKRDAVGLVMSSGRSVNSEAKVSRSRFYRWRRTATARAARQAVEVGLAARIRKVHQDSDGT
ncbi:hypothetical protein [Streptomyces beijiangensis]|uniref:Transposase n=1 Tax=Streptomyces beijiangensis TaxID=163361 RepID=A0A939F0U0_9ACTN|nr:hypothetical protein [Streptomyces beijiangensis]MBO0510426.1 hypothetical protein [Streptomyces beijiangensis]